MSDRHADARLPLTPQLCESGVVAILRGSSDLNYRSALWSAAEASPALEAAVRGADIVFAGELEAEIVTGTADALEAALALEEMMPARPASQVVFKRGAEGCLARIGGATLDQPAPAVTVVDTVGAGDACVAGYLAELMAGAHWADANP